MTKNGKIFLLLFVGGGVIEIIGTILDSLAMICGGGVALLIACVMLFVSGNNARKQSAQNQIKALESISTNFSYNPDKKHLVIKNRCPENVAAFGVKDYKRQNYSDVPAKLVYTGASVGGITTGGVHLSGGYTSVANGIKSGKCILLYSWYNGKEVETGDVETIDVSNSSDDNYHSSKISKYVRNRKIIVVDNTAKTKMAGSLAYLKMNVRSATTLNMYEDAVIEDYPSEEKCLEIVSWICGEN